MMEVASRCGCAPSPVERDEMADRIHLMGLALDPVTEDEAIGRVLAGLRTVRGGWVATLNVDRMRLLSSRPDLTAFVSSADLILADGMPLVWASKVQGTPLPARVSGSTLILSLTEAAALAGFSIFLLGGSPITADKAAKVITQKFPRVRIAGTLSPAWGFEENEAQLDCICDIVAASSPNIVYCCLGFGKEELVIRRLSEVLPTSWFLGLGGSLTMLSGEIPRAPLWMQRGGLEWLWRLLKEPRRLAGRYLVHDPAFALRLLRSARQQRRALRGTLARPPDSETKLRSERSRTL